ncbi:DUF5688 family protein [Butyrivibrio sp. MC2021]|uniref:DUF5688 family protein n=1 Tax=Butyrivibrio sp. MC2021 TaxID=1408306 RepID=UPI00047D73F7|nr:DUF5688 family protein [Butyrivibrio sp. MC2021]
MDFETFKEELKEDVKRALEEKTDSQYSVELHTQEKMNETYDALTIKPEDSEIGVSLNTDSLYKAYSDGMDYDRIVSETVGRAESALANRPDFNIDAFKDYDKMKETLAMEVVSAERNADLLETVPHKNMEDMAVVYRFVVSSDVGETGSVLVTNKMLDQYGITPEQLHADAMKNAPEVRPMEIKGMGEVLAEQMGIENAEMLGFAIPPEQDQMLVASVKGNVHGAGVLAYEDFMDKASDRVGGSFFILPSSIHEILIIPDNGQFDLKSLENMVREVNATTVDPVDKLTDNVYHYDAQDKVFELGEKYVERQNQKEQEAIKDEDVIDDLEAFLDAEDTPEKKPEDRASVFDKLDAAKEKAATQPVKDAVNKAKEHGGPSIG